MNSYEETDIQVFGRIDQIVNALRDHPGPQRLCDIARWSGLHTATTCRILKDMVSLGYAAKGNDHRYTLGPKWLVIVDQVLNQTEGKQT